MNLNSSLTLASETPLEKEEARKVATILALLLQHPSSSEFHSPVDPQTLPDYHQIVEHPMDLGTVKAKLEEDKYRFVEQFVDDLQIIWDNCKLYNEAGSWICDHADKMEKHTKKLIKNYFGNVIIVQSKSQTNNKASIPAKKKPAYPAYASAPSIQPIATQSQIVSRSAAKQIPQKEANQKEAKEASQKDTLQLPLPPTKLLALLKRQSAQTMGAIMAYLMQNCPKSVREVDYDKYIVVVGDIDGPARQYLQDIISIAGDTGRKKVKIT